jgi:hypothetical protein
MPRPRASTTFVLRRLPVQRILASFLERGAALCAAPLSYARTMRVVLDILAEGNMQEPPL